MAAILIIDDDESLTDLLKTYLSNQGFSVSVASNGYEGFRFMFNNPPDLVLLDVTMPKQDGWTTLFRIREVSNVPVIMLTARSEEVNILKGFSNGADDYVTKPFSFAQLAARIQAILARIETHSPSNQKILKQGEITLDLRTKQVWLGKEQIQLTPTEFKLLKVLMTRAGEVVSTEELVREVWGAQYAGEVGHVRRYIWHLRKKIEADSDNFKYLHNERGFGYRFQVLK